MMCGTCFERSCIESILNSLVIAVLFVALLACTIDVPFVPSFIEFLESDADGSLWFVWQVLSRDMSRPAR